EGVAEHADADLPQLTGPCNLRSGPDAGLRLLTVVHDCRPASRPPRSPRREILRRARSNTRGDGRLKTSLWIWALGSMVTRFVPAGYQPQWVGESTTDRVRRAIDGLGDLMDGYEFHYPQELSEDNVDEVREALGDHEVYCIASGLHLDPRFGRGGLISPDAETRAEAVRRTVAAADFAGRLGAHFIVWPGIEGYNYPFQTPYKESWAWFLEG